MLQRKPRKGDLVAWRDRDGKLYSHALVLRIEGNQAWIKPKDGSDAAPFTWFFPRESEMNKLAEIVEEGPDTA